jgi:uncharacterized membrane protein
MGGNGGSCGKRLQLMAAVMLSLTAFGCAASSENDAAGPGEAAQTDSFVEVRASEHEHAFDTLTPPTGDTDSELHAAPETAFDRDALHAAEPNAPLPAADPAVAASRPEPMMVEHAEAADSAQTSEETPMPVQAAQPMAAAEPLEMPKLNPAAGPCEVSAFIGLGEGTQASGASADGSVIVGSANSHAFRWTSSFCFQSFFGLDFATGVSPNGVRITGSASGVAVVWNDTSNSAEVVLEPRPGSPYHMISGGVVLDDGKLYGTCRSLYSPIVNVACAWDGSWLNLLGVATVNAADATGAFAGMANRDLRASDVRRPAVLSGEELNLPSSCFPTLGCSAELRAFNAEHSVAVGTASLTLPSADLAMAVSTNALFDTAVIYTPATLLQRLADLAGGDVGAGAYAVSADGRIIAGFASDALGRRAALWIDRQPRALADVLDELGVDVPCGWVLSVVRAISADGRVLVGNGVDPNGQPQAFRVVLPSSL